MRRLTFARYLALAAVSSAAVIAAACSSEEAAVPTQAPAKPAATAEPAATAKPAATVVPAATTAPAPTATAKPAPTATTAPTATPANQPVKGGTLKMSSVGSIQSFDPLWTTASATANVAHSILEGLLVFNDDYSLGNQLVASWSSSTDGLTWTVKMRPGVKFHDGTPMTTKQVVATLKRQAARAAVFSLVQKQFGAPEFENFVKTVDDLTFTINVKEATGLVPFTLGPQNFAPLVITEAWAAVPALESAKGEPIGTGPYKFEKWTPGDRWSMVRFDGYTPSSDKANGQAGAQIAYFDRVEYIEIPDQTTRVAALETGEVDVAQEFPADLEKRLSTNPRVQLVAQAPFRLLGHFNHTKAPFNNVEARKALIQAYDNAKALLLATGDATAFRLCPSLMQCGTSWETSAGAAAYYNVRKVADAKAKIAALGFAGTKVRLMDPTDRAPAHAASQVTREVLADIGFDVDFLVMDWATQTTRRADPLLWEFFHTWSGSSVRSGPVGHFQFGELQYDAWFNKYQDVPGTQRALFGKLARETDPAKQKALMDQMQTYFYDDAIFLQIGEFFSKWAARADLKGIVPVSPAAQQPANKWIAK